jgi:hypothetical protein
MTADRRRQLLMGGGAGSILVLAIWILWPASPAPSASASTPVRARATRSADQGAEVTPVDPVKLGTLKDGRDEPGQASRNPFRFQPKVAPAPPRPMTPPTEPVTAAPPRPMPPPGPPPAPPIPLKFIGVVTRENGVKWAVLTDGKSPTPFSGKDGDSIDGRYRIVKIGEESIEMTYIDGRGRQVIRLTGQ